MITSLIYSKKMDQEIIAVVGMSPGWTKIGWHKGADNLLVQIKGHKEEGTN